MASVTIEIWKLLGSINLCAFVLYREHFLLDFCFSFVLISTFLLSCLHLFFWFYSFAHLSVRSVWKMLYLRDFAIFCPVLLYFCFAFFLPSSFLLSFLYSSSIPSSISLFGSFIPSFSFCFCYMSFMCLCLILIDSSIFYVFLILIDWSIHEFRHFIYSDNHLCITDLIIFIYSFNHWAMSSFVWLLTCLFIFVLFIRVLNFTFLSLIQFVFFFLSFCFILSNYPRISKLFLLGLQNDT